MDDSSLAARHEPFPVSEARRLVSDLFAPKPWLYWLDFLTYIALGWASFVATLTLPAFSPLQLLFFLLSVLTLYRSAIFIHELAHLKKGTFKVFRLVWNLVCGFPLMLPSFTYRGVHNDHHKRDIYGTSEDGEYLPFARSAPREIVVYVLLSFVLPLLFAGRFVVLAPISYLHEKLRGLAWKRASSLSIDLSYRRPPPSARDEEAWGLQEACTFLYGASAIALVATGVLPYGVLVLWYLVAWSIFFLNSFRTLAAHSYRNPGDQVMDLSEQYLDSVNVPGNRFLTALWAPVGLRYHATHHLFPSMPYHALGEAHRRLMGDPSVAPAYRRTVRSSLWDAVNKLWGEARLNQTSRPRPDGAEAKNT